MIGVLLDVVVHAMAALADTLRGAPRFAAGEARFDSKTGKQIK